MNVGHERLKTLYAVIAGLPAKKVNLRSFFPAFMTSGCNVYPDATEWIRQEMLDEHNCGSVACAAGWAAVYPEFNALGLKPSFHGVEYQGLGNFMALAAFFEMSSDDASDIFDRKVTSKYTRGLITYYATDRRTALHRIRLYLLEHGAITQARSQELQLHELYQESDDKEKA